MTAANTLGQYHEQANLTASPQTISARSKRDLADVANATTNPNQSFQNKHSVDWGPCYRIHRFVAPDAIFDEASSNSYMRYMNSNQCYRGKINEMFHP
ncbi:hypothetical protein RBSH_03186 [Rhodopirellula baltica SH28]|uniref:Uncharacterized protein n=2 Tax=Rhodopirellula baltica TaxID=265606 RepID=K5CD42_RHOBT|nr:hypothetical protein RBSH_03186 [Rhodopirellula baltica SH28]ELP29979.1 hypothetical protein RBSWK_06067 [Rhodopirellula baltica SWK14]